jgi:hypothetical protein
VADKFLSAAKFSMTSCKSFQRRNVIHQSVQHVSNATHHKLHQPAIVPQLLHQLSSREPSFLCAVLPTEADIDKLGREAPRTFISDNRSRKSSRRTP